MSRKAYFYIAIFLGLLIILLTVGGLYLKHQSFLARRHHLLCEVLKPGMSKDEVLSVLHQVGDFRVDQIDWTSESFVLDVIFADPDIMSRYGYFSIVFIDQKYMRAVVSRGSGPPIYICDFYQATPSITDAP